MKKVLKLIAALFIIGTFIVVFLAISRQDTYPDEMRNTVENETLYLYYESTGKFPDAYTHDPIDDFDFKGVIQAKHLTYIPEANQVQISVRYGTLLFEALAEKYSLAELPTLENCKPTFKLKALEVADTAFSGDDKTLEEDEILDECVIESSTSLDITSGRHNYSRLVFDGVDFEKYNCLYIELYYGEETEQFTSLIIYHEDAAAYGEQVKLTEADLTR